MKIFSKQLYSILLRHESHNSGLKKYQPEDSWNPFLGLSVSYKLFPQLTLLSSARYTMLDDQIKNSPMVDSAYDFSLFTGVSWSS
ncbi:MipA/OmpV family protein [Hafnia paralvei]|uniref:MipA/OmpV family protein n=1 Tax=Hafnia paralvei TaxID=546367 RepID=UPI00107D18EC